MSMKQFAPFFRRRILNFLLKIVTFVHCFHIQILLPNLLYVKFETSSIVSIVSDVSLVER